MTALLKPTPPAVLAPAPDAPQAAGFDLEKMASHGPGARLMGWLFDKPQWWMQLLRDHLPVLRLPGGFALLTRYDHVQEALQKEAVFQVPFGPRMEAMTKGTNFVLGQQDGPDYQRSRAQIMAAFRRDDVRTLIGPMCAQWARDIVAGAPGRLDAVHDLVTRVPTLLCRDYYGIPMNDPARFADWTIAMSGYIFGPPGPHSPLAEMAEAAAACVLPVIDHAIAATRAAQPRPDTIVARFLAQQEAGGDGPSDLAIRGHLYGMVTGFVPTNSIAAGHMLDVLLSRPEQLALAQAAARADDDLRLQRILFEALRYKPINPGPFRVCAQDHTLGAGTPDAATIKAGTVLMVGTSRPCSTNAACATRRPSTRTARPATTCTSAMACTNASAPNWPRCRSRRPSSRCCSARACAARPVRPGACAT